MKKVYFSYSYSDLETRQLIEYLNHNFVNLNISITNTQEMITNEYDLKTSITEQINKSDALIYFANKNTPYMIFELGYAYGRNKDIVIIGDYNELPIDISDAMIIQKGLPHYEVLNSIFNYLYKYSLNCHDEVNEMTKDLNSLVKNPDLIENMNYQEFEEVVINFLIENGFVVNKNSKERDLGFDASLISPDGMEILVEIKKYRVNNLVPVSVVRQLAGSMALKKVHRGIIIASSGFSKSSIYYADEIGIENNLNISLYTLKELINRVTNHTA